MAEPTPGTQLTGLGKFISIALILGLVGVGAWVAYSKANPEPEPRGTGGGGGPKPPVETGGPQDPKALKEDPANNKSPDVPALPTYVPATMLPPVKGTSNYEWDDKTKTVVFSYNVWAGWLPVIAANRGTEPNDESVFWKKYGFHVKLQLMDDPVAARDAFAAGKVHTLWGTVDMIVLFAPELRKDSRSSPRIVQQIDWSNGGDGIVARSAIKTINQLKGKTVALAQNSPSEYYLTSMMIAAGLKPSDVKTKYTNTAFEASAAFQADKSVDACVSWAPDIYNIPQRVAGTHLLSSTGTANKLIADVYAIRADFVKDHPDIVEGLVAGIFEGMDMVEKDPTEAARHMAAAFNMKPDEILGMRNDAHQTNFAENEQFFLNTSSATNFQRTWQNAGVVYNKLGKISSAVPYEEVMDFSYLQAIGKKGLFKHHTDKNVAQFAPGPIRTGGKAEEVLIQTIRINFYPNSDNPYEPARDQFGNVVPGKLHDQTADGSIEAAGINAGQNDRAIIVIRGHTDASMKGRVPVQAVKDLSKARAEAVKTAMVNKFKFNPNKFVTEGAGWDQPFDPQDKDNHVLNRRVEISVVPPEE